MPGVRRTVVLDCLGGCFASVRTAVKQPLTSDGKWPGPGFPLGRCKLTFAGAAFEPNVNSLARCRAHTDGQERSYPESPPTGHSSVERKQSGQDQNVSVPSAYLFANPLLLPRGILSSARAPKACKEFAL